MLDLCGSAVALCCCRLLPGIPFFAGRRLFPCRTYLFCSLFPAAGTCFRRSSGLPVALGRDFRLCPFPMAEACRKTDAPLRCLCRFPGPDVRLCDRLLPRPWNCGNSHCGRRRLVLYQRLFSFQASPFPHRPYRQLDHHDHLLCRIDALWDQLPVSLKLLYSINGKPLKTGSCRISGAFLGFLSLQRI